MKGNISRREAIQLMVSAATAFLVSCANRTRNILPTPSQEPAPTSSQTPSDTPTQIPTEAPAATATQPPEPTATVEAESAPEVDTPVAQGMATVYMTKTSARWIDADIRSA